MLAALIANGPPPAFCNDESGNPQIFTAIPSALKLPTGSVVEGIPAVPWTSQDGAYSLVNVTPFVPPGGQIATGAPSYAIDGQGRVSQSFATTSAAPSTALAQYSAAIAVGIAITSTGTPALSGTYALDPGTMQALYNLGTYIATNGTYPAGNATLNWPDLAGTVHTFGITSTFKAFVKALQDYVAKLAIAQASAAAGGNPTWPTASATIP